MSEEEAEQDPAAPRLRWWREVVYILVFYGVYTAIRNTQGSAAVSEATARDNAELIIDWERAIGLFQEHRIQSWFIDHRWFIQFWNIFYGTAHFIVTAAALIFMFRRLKDRYPLWRNTLACTTALALIGFATFPLMPPRLLGQYGFVDTLAEIGGLWSFDEGAMAKVSNQYAAMPSLHFGWASWSALVLLQLVRVRWGRWLAIAYPFLTLFAIIVTANHYWLDAVGGAIVLAAGYGLGRAITAFNTRARLPAFAED